MTLTFHLYLDGIEVAEPAIYARDLKAYAADSKHAEEQRRAFKRRTVRASIRYLHNRLFNRLTLPNSTVSLLVAGTLLATHAIYI